MSERLLQLGHLPNNQKRSGWQMLLSRYDGQAKLLNWLLLPRSHNVYPRPPEGWPEWNSTEETREAYLSHIEKETLETIKTNRFLSVGRLQRRRGLINSILNIAHSYCNKVEKAQRLRGLCRVGFSKNIERNLLWSVEFQILGKTYTAIANEHSLQQSQRAGEGTTAEINITTVKRAVEKTLKFVGLDKRPDSGPGRKRGTGDTAQALITRRLGR
jgi:hypothetical protein